MSGDLPQSVATSASARSIPAPVAVRTASLASRRIVATAVAVGAAGVLGLAARLDPSPAGLGTHEQLNLPACGWIVAGDLPCPTCGMTTSFAHAADGDLLGSFLAQPLGFLLALGTAMALLLGVYVAVTGSAVASILPRLWTRGTAWGIGAVLLCSWLFKIVQYKGLL
jgi:hypothetical protein